jgi:hypothetical protein
MAAKKTAKKAPATRDEEPSHERTPQTVEGTTREHRAVDATKLRDAVKAKGKRR